MHATLQTFDIISPRIFIFQQPALMTVLQIYEVNFSIQSSQLNSKLMNWKYNI